MDLLREWLGPTIEQELGEVLRWQGMSEANRSQLTGQVGDLLLDDDGSNLRIRSAKKQVVQIIKLVPDQEPLQGCLSDSVNRVDAIISKDAVQKYTEKTGKRLTDGTIGGFIQLIKFEIVATHMGSKQKRITLFVTDFKFLGSNTSGGFGIPQAIQDRTMIKDLLLKLIDFRGQEFARWQAPSREQYSSKDVMSQPDSVASQENSPRNTQAMFATQPPVSKVPATSSPNAKASSNGFPINPRNTVPQKHQAHAKTSVNKTKCPISEGEALLGLLQRSKKQLPITTVASEEPTRSHLANGLITHPETGTFTVQVDSMGPPRITASEMADDPGQPSFPVSIPVVSEGTIQRDASKAGIPAYESERNKRETMTSFSTRISSRDVKISKEQEKLLISADSWLPAEPGRRGPVANVPIAILQGLNQKAEIQASRRGNFLKEKKHIRGPEELQENHRPSSFDGHDSSLAESDSDAPIPDSEWPPSPAQDQLPPDSSAENTDVQSNPSAHIRRSSNASLSSRLSQSRRPTPLRVMRSSRNSAEPAQPIISPSIISNSARQGSQQQSRGGTPKSAARDSTPISIGNTSAISHSMEQSAFDGHHGRVDGDGSVEEVLAAPEDTTPAIKRQRTPGISEILSELRPRHDNDLRRSPEVRIKKPSLYIDLSQEQVLSPHRASTPLEPSPLQSSRAHSTTEKLDGGHHHKTSSGLYSIPPSPESDLEMAAPFSLNDKAIIPRESIHQSFPSTASQRTEPFTQVKRTPYVNGQVRNHSPPRLERQLSFSKSNASHSVANGIPLEDVDHVTQSTPSILEVSGSEAVINNPKDNLGMEGSDQASATMKAVDDKQSYTMHPNGNRESREHEILTAGLDNSNMPEAIEKLHAAASSEEEGTVEVNAQGNSEKLVAHINYEMKRKAFDLDFLSTNVAKRRKKLRIPPAFPTSENIENLPDPLDAARRYRQDFIISRKSSETGKPQKTRSKPIASPIVGPPEFRDLGTSPEVQAEFEVVSEADRQTGFDDKAQAPGLRNYQAMESDLILSKQSTGDESDQVNRISPSNGEPMVCFESNKTILGTKVSETEAQPNSLPLNALEEVRPNSKMRETHPAAEYDSAQKKNMRKSSKFVNSSDNEDGLKDAMARAIPNAISDHTLNDDDAQKATPIDQFLKLGAKITGPDLQHDHFMDIEVDDATAGAQAVSATDFEAGSAKMDESADQAMHVGANDAGPRVQRDQIVASNAIKLPGNYESMDLDSGSTRSYPTYDNFAEVEAPDITPGAQHGEAMDIQPDDLNGDTRSTEIAKLTEDEPGLHVKSNSLNISGNRSRSDDREVQSTIGNQEYPPPDHSESISESPKAPKTLIAEADRIKYQPSAHALSPAQVATDTSRCNLQEGLEYEAPVTAMSMRPGKSGVTDPPNPSAVVQAPVPNNDAKSHYSSHPAEQGALPEMPNPDANVKTAAVVVACTAEDREHETPAAPRNIFDRFKAAYPAYSGDLKHFVAVCRKIKTLVDLDRMQHQYLWDDFIIRHRIEYAQHLRQCAEDAEDALPWEDFYKTEIPKPLYTNEVVTHRRLDEVLSLLDIKFSAPRKRSVNDTETPIKPMRNARTIHQEPSSAPRTPSSRAQNRSERRETIDLTLDDREGHSIKISEETSMIPPINSIRKARRSLPWMETNTQAQVTSPQKLRLPFSGHGGVEARSPASNEPSDMSSKLDRKVDRKPDAMTDGRSIREAWGVGAHDVLEPHYYDKISPRHLRLMKDIANVVDLEEARRLIYKKIHSRTRLNLAASKTVTVTDLEAVFDALLTKNVKKPESRVKEDFAQMKMRPPEVHQTRASHRKREEERHGEWWEDDNTPFKSYAKAYKSIKPGNGNSYAKEEPVKTEAGPSRDGKRDKESTKKAIDPLSWDL